MDKPPEFDRYARDYTRLHGESIRASGEEPAYFAASKAAYVARAVAGQPPARLLDFGCGIGGTLGFLRDALPGTKLHGMDVSPESLAMARQAHPDVALNLIEGDRLAMDDDAVDVAVAACVFHHIAPVERANWLSRIAPRAQAGRPPVRVRTQSVESADAQGRATIARSTRTPSCSAASKRAA